MDSASNFSDFSEVKISVYDSFPFWNGKNFKVVLFFEA